MNPNFIPTSFLLPQASNSIFPNLTVDNASSLTDLYRIGQQNLLLHVRNMQLNLMRNSFSNSTVFPSKISNVLQNQSLIKPLEAYPSLPLQPPVKPLSEEVKIMKSDTSSALKLSAAISTTNDSQNKTQKLALKKQIELMLRFIMANINGNTSSEIDARREIYAQDSILLQIYDKLVMKYYSAKKCREDIVRYILRKFFKILRTNISRDQKISYRKTTLLLCKKYFSSKVQEMQDKGIKLENEEEVLEFFMPFRKNSKNKTMNTNFVCEIFSSPEIREEYEKFLKKFEKHIQADNNIKVQKTMQVLLECTQKKDLAKLTSFNRFPWLDSWIENTISIAFSLKPENNPTSAFKVLKKEEYETI